MLFFRQHRFLAGAFPHNRRRAGVALFLVLAVLALLSILVVAFLASVSSETTTSYSYSSGASVKQLADSAVQLVEAQVLDGTKGKDASANLVAWASQPGLIRTYDTQGKPSVFYKLYSAGLPLAITGATLDSFDPADTPAPGWNDPANAAVYSANLGLYTDLNSPVIRDGKAYFPIIDGNGIKSLTVGGAPMLTYSADGTAQDIEGFSVKPSGVSYNAGSSPSSANNPVPMPVKWLYVLQDGGIASPASGSGGIVTFDPAFPVPSSSNPVVGRVAFWADDDACKVNVNTASEGTFWDRPWANTTTEQNLATAIPDQNEYQRFPGHPAKTSLSTVFGSLLASPTLSPPWYAGISSGQQSTNQNQLKAYYDLVARIADGGTRAGSVNETTATGTANSMFSPVVLDADRLYASSDEMFYSPALAASSRVQNNASVTGAFLRKAKFFLTAHSRAPDTNLFGKPRITLWPIQQDSSQRNAKDRLISFCGTVAGKAYYLQRHSTYLSPATLGAGAPSASSQSPVFDWTDVPRNQTLYTYLDQITSQNIPGFGGSFAAKYGATRQQILTEMFDQIRSGVNAYSNGLAPSYNYAPSYLDPGEGQVVPLVPPAGTPGNGTHGFGRFVTITGATMDFFRSNQAYYRTQGATQANPVIVDPGYVTDLNPNGVIIGPGAQIGAALILNPFTPSPGFPPWSPNVQYVVAGMEGFKIRSAGLGGAFVSMGFPAKLKNTVTSRADFSGMWNCSPFFGLIANFRYAATAGTAGTDGTKSAGFTDPIQQYPFMIPTTTGTNQSPPLSGVQLAPTDKTFDFSGGTITVTIYSGSDGSPTSAANTSPGTPIQTISMTFPPVNGLRVPTAVPTWAPNNLVPGTVPGINLFGPTATYLSEGTNGALSKPWHDWLIYYTPVPTPATSNPYPRAQGQMGNGLDTTGKALDYHAANIARGIEADPDATAKGDYRFYAALSSVPAAFFKPSAGYDFPLGGPQQYLNVQSLRDQGTDGSGGGGFGYDAQEPGGYYKHYLYNPAGSSAARNQVQPQTAATGVLIPRNLLAAYGNGDQKGSATGDREYRAQAVPAVPPGLQGAYLSNGNYGDWDNATGQIPDGPYINKPDEGNSATVSNTTNYANLNAYYGGNDIGGGYFSQGYGVGDYKADTGQTLSPNRQIASAVMFGSLPTGVDATGGTAPKPWQTLLFCPNPLANSSAGGAQGTSHPGFGTSTTGAGDAGPPYTSPPDHLMLDLFTMPIVEPYAISDPFSTAGRINMNYQIAPFTYITRDTGVRAVLKASRIMAIPQSASTYTATAASYKDGTRSPFEFRYNINPDENTGTLKGFENRFDKKDIFRSASEICGVFLVPQLIPHLSTGTSYPAGSTPPTSYAGASAWWSSFLLTGDNTREMPYGDLYPRLTTKSNTFTVHVRVQTLKKIPNTSATQWVEGKDQITGEYRGSQTIERYIDTGAPNLPDFADPSSASVESFYKIRVINSTAFTP